MKAVPTLGNRVIILVLFNPISLVELFCLCTAVEEHTIVGFMRTVPFNIT